MHIYHVLLYYTDFEHIYGKELDRFKDVSRWGFTRKSLQRMQQWLNRSNPECIFGDTNMGYQ